VNFPRTIGEAALTVLSTPDPQDKVAAALAAAAAWSSGGLARDAASLNIPDRPARPERPELRAPGEMPRRAAGGAKGRIALLHAVAHIEFNAIDLAWDMVARFGPRVDDKAFIDDWVRVGGEEARHFSLVRGRLRSLHADYGDLPAHDGLWEAATDTADSVLARLAVVPLVLEARGLDVTPPMVNRFRETGDEDSASLLELILREEVGHVATGMRWFQTLCAKTGQDPVETFHNLVRKRFKGELKPPFNEAARERAGLLPAFYRTC